MQPEELFPFQDSLSRLCLPKSIYKSFLCISRVCVRTRASAVFRFFAFTLHPAPVSRWE